MSRSWPRLWALLLLSTFFCLFVPVDKVLKNRFSRSPFWAEADLADNVRNWKTNEPNGLDCALIWAFFPFLRYSNIEGIDAKLSRLDVKTDKKFTKICQEVNRFKNFASFLDCFGGQYCQIPCNFQTIRNQNIHLINEVTSKSNICLAITQNVPEKCPINSKSIS